jgi:cytidylate kinase
MHTWRHWETSRKAHGGAMSGMPVPSFTIALSREAGIDASAIVAETARRLGWSVYDRELLEKIAREMGLRTTLLESVDERRGSWLRECLEQFASAPTVSESAYVRHLIETIASLGAHGQCIIVGRGAAQLLPPATTLRVRLVASLKERIAAVSKELGLAAAEAARRLDKIDCERRQFIKDHFRKDVADVSTYDLILNVGRFDADECAGLIVEALARLQARAAVPEGVGSRRVSKEESHA